jgi:hypothetical protein
LKNEGLPQNKKIFVNIEMFFTYNFNFILINYPDKSEANCTNVNLWCNDTAENSKIEQLATLKPQKAQA